MARRRPSTRCRRSHRANGESRRARRRRHRRARTRRRRDGRRARSRARTGSSTSRSGAHPRSSHGISGVSVSSSTTSRAPIGSSANAVTAGSGRGSIPSRACTSSGVSSIRSRASSCRTGSQPRSPRGSRRRRPMGRPPIRSRRTRSWPRWPCTGWSSAGAGGGEHARGSGRPEVTVVIDTREHDDAGGPVVDWGLPVELPIEVLLEMAQTGDVAAVVVRNGAVIHAPGVARLGPHDAARECRPAAGAARPVPDGVRSLTARCASTTARSTTSCGGGTVGRTDLDNLLPVCFRHHQLIHHAGWVVELAPRPHPDRHVARRRGVMTTGPPSRAAA